MLILLLNELLASLSMGGLYARAKKRYNDGQKEPCATMDQHRELARKDFLDVVDLTT